MLGKLFMAFATGRETTESHDFKLFTGYSPVHVCGVNFSKEELEKFYDRALDKDVEYVTEKDGVKSVRIDFAIQTPEDAKYHLKNRITFFLRDIPRTNKDNTKCQIIDKYGRTAWVTNEEFAQKAIPMYKNGPANIDKDYRKCYTGEEELTSFIINYLNIENPMSYVNGVWIPNPRISDYSVCEARLDNITNYFKNDFSELKTIAQLQPKNKIMVCFGVRTTDDGRQYQTVYSRQTARYGANVAVIEKSINERKAAGGLGNEEYTFGELVEYNVTPSTLEEVEERNANTPWNESDSSSDMPF